MLSCVPWQCFRFVPPLLNMGGCFAESLPKLFSLKVEEKELSSEFPGLSTENSKGLGNWLKILVLPWVMSPWIFTSVKPIQKFPSHLLLFELVSSTRSNVQWNTNLYLLKLGSFNHVPVSWFYVLYLHKLKYLERQTYSTAEQYCTATRKPVQLIDFTCAWNHSD